MLSESLGTEKELNFEIQGISKAKYYVLTY